MTEDGPSSVALRRGVDGLAEGQLHGASGQHQNFEKREKRNMERLSTQTENLHTFLFCDCL